MSETKISQSYLSVDTIRKQFDASISFRSDAFLEFTWHETRSGIEEISIAGPEFLLILRRVRRDSQRRDSRRSELHLSTAAQ